MQRQKVRVVLASEYSQARHFLRDVVEEEGGAVIVGQAENASKALTLARNLRPDIALIDCHLPHAVGLDTVALSRIGGLDTAQNISGEVPNTRAILLYNLDEEVLSKYGLGSSNVAFFSREINGVSIPFALQELYHEVLAPNAIIFANVEVKQQDALRQKIASISDKAVLFGGIGIVGGLCLMLTVILAGAGVFLALAGAAVMFLGLAGKLTASLWRRAPQQRSQAIRD